MIWQLFLLFSYFTQDVWTELGRPGGIHQKQVSPSFSSFTSFWKIYWGCYLSVLCPWGSGCWTVMDWPCELHRWTKWEFILHQILGHEPLSVVITSIITSAVAWTYYSMGRYPVFSFIKFTTICISLLVWVFMLCWIYRHIKSRNLFCTRTILDMRILIHTWSATS